MSVRVHAIISGRVQGVSYRATCRDEAANRNLTGWVRNLSDGGVEAVFEGTESDVNAMLEWCRRGPPLASVRDVAIAWEPPQGERGFRITH
jgi:acylphosphatase